MSSTLQFPLTDDVDIEQRAPVQERQWNRSGYFRVKPILDRIAAAGLLVPAIPLIGLFAVLLRIRSSEPAVLSNARVGLHGERFSLYRLRTTRTTSTGPQPTALGRFLVRTSLDRLPQLVNVLRGELAMVGPKPDREEITFVVGQQLPSYSERLAVLPGITGLAQVNQPLVSDIATVAEHLEEDRKYIECATLWLDIHIIARAVFSSVLWHQAAAELSSNNAIRKPR